VTSVLDVLQVHSSVSGVAHGHFENDVAALRAARDLLAFLPLNNR
jgi:acetyl-CoA carboxylase carboxyltransferase component